MKSCYDLKNAIFVRHVLCLTMTALLRNHDSWRDITATSRSQKVHKL
jgi:hypothetical protein